MATDKEYLLTDAFNLIVKVSEGQADGNGMCAEIGDWLRRAERLDVGVRPETLRVRAKCAQDGHPGARAVSCPLGTFTEYHCEVCEEYFTRDE